ncbi:MAG: hypothetical protein J3R72DRAFT_423123 [Linnemannia gamsii]|nr:MAG: hypothetical protein J3R72DRAFT_423123 [Linnemannia gamsii]
MENIKYFEDVALAHEDDRRIIYDPNIIPTHFSDTLYLHNMILVKDSESFLGNHKHSQDMVYFTPNGNLVISFTLSGHSKVYELKKGSMVFIPADVYSTVKGKEGSIVYGFGNGPYADTRTEPSDPETQQLLESLIDAHLESLEKVCR